MLSGDPTYGLGVKNSNNVLIDGGIVMPEMVALCAAVSMIFMKTVFMTAPLVPGLTQ